jgi:predicted transcriptional regulator of viral defense system
VTEAARRWAKLVDIALPQEGHFSSDQAARAGYSSQLLIKHVRAGRVVSIRRGVYRLVEIREGKHEGLVVIWLWSGREGVFSHETALTIHRLCAGRPDRCHLSLPTARRRIRIGVPPGVALHYADVGDSERTWNGAVSLTSVGRTLLDCAVAGMSQEAMDKAIHAACRRRLVSQNEIAEVKRARVREPLGGLE